MGIAETMSDVWRDVLDFPGKSKEKMNLRQADPLSEKEGETSHPWISFARLPE